MPPRSLTVRERKKLQERAFAIREKQILTHVASGVSVSWAWFNNDPSQGIVQWTFKNSDTKQHSIILLRNTYYFGGAFWPVYYANSNGRGASATNPEDNFGVDFLDGSKEIQPLANKGVLNNSAPLALVTFNNQDPAKISKDNSVVCFIFTLAPGETWSILEGGFSQQFTPSGISLYEVSPLYGGNLCIGYDPQRVLDWDIQTGTNLQGYEPNPSTFNTWLLQVESDAPFDVLPFNDNYSYGACQGTSDCTEYFQNAISDIGKGDLAGAIKEALSGIDCILSGGTVSLEKEVLDKIRNIKELVEKLRHE